MYRRILLLLSPVALLLTLGAIAQPSPVGAPWISVEMPANPLDESTRGAAFVVRAYYHENPARFPIAGRAEGLVNGERQTIELQVTETPQAGVYVVKQQWPSQGHWLLAMNVAIESGPSLVVELGPNGGVSDGAYYGGPTKTLAVRSVRVVRGKINGNRIEQALRTMAMK